MGRGSVRQSLAWRLDVVFYEISFSPDVSESSKKQVRRCFMKQTRAETFENVSRQGEFTVRSTSGLSLAQILLRVMLRRLCRRSLLPRSMNFAARCFVAKASYSENVFCCKAGTARRETQSAGNARP